MQGKRILLGVTGGIAAYKSPDLVRRLREQGAEVQVVMTAAAREFVTATTFQAVSGRPVRTDLWDAAAEAAMGHIELARWAQLVLIAPASADFLARLAAGHADDLLSTLCLATEAPIAVAPAMNRTKSKSVLYSCIFRECASLEIYFLPDGNLFRLGRRLFYHQPNRSLTSCIPAARWEAGVGIDLIWQYCESDIPGAAVSNALCNGENI